MIQSSGFIVSAAVAIGAVAGIGAASAADLPARAYTKAPAHVDAGYNWSGFYAGFNVGGAWGNSDVSSAVVNTNGSNVSDNQRSNQRFLSAVDSPRLKPSGFTGGGQIGYNYQIDKWVLGIEADFSYFGLRDSRTDTAPFPFLGGTFTTTNSVKTDWLATVRPRLGYAFNRTLLYVTGGLAATEDFRESESGSSSKTKAGWTVGGGVEHAFLNNWSAKLEYLYTDFGSLSVGSQHFRAQLPVSRVSTHDVDLKANIVRIGVNYKFGGPAVAQY
jgi:outer membrane immunogenic protein